MDLGGFKQVNDKFGHDSGDLLLQKVEKRLNDSVREEDLIARVGGDEFIIVFVETDKEEVEGISQRILTDISQPFMIKNQQLNISPSVSISMYPMDGEGSDMLIKNADKAMYPAKNKGKNCYQYYHPDLDNLKVKKYDFMISLKK